MPLLHLLSQQSNVGHFIHNPPCSCTISINNCTRLHPPSPSSSTIPIVKCATPHPPSPLFINYPNSQMYDASSTMPPLHLLSQLSNVRHFIHNPPCSSISLVKCTTLHPPSPIFIYYPNSRMYDTSSTILPVHLLSQQSIVRNLIHHTPLHLLSQQSNVRHFIHHPPLHLLSQQSNVRGFIHNPPLHLLFQQSIVRHVIHHPASSSTIPIVKCTTLHPPSPLFIYYPISQMYEASSTIPLFIYYPNSQMYDTSSTIPPLHLLSQQSNVRRFIHHAPSSSTIPIVKCTTLLPQSPLFIYYLNSQMYETSSTIALFIYYPNSQMYDTSSTIPPLHLLSQQSNVRRFIHHAPSSSTIAIVKCTTLHPQSPCSSISIVKCTTLHPPSPCSSTIPLVKCTTLHPPSPCSSTIPIVECMTLHPPSSLFIYYPNSQLYETSSTIPLFIYYPNSQMYDTSSTIRPVHLLSQQSNVRHIIHSPPVHLSQKSNVRHFFHHPPLHLLSQQSNVRGFIHNPPLHLLFQQSIVRHVIHHLASSSTIPIVKCTTLHPPSPLFIYYPISQMYEASSTIPLFIYYPNSQMYDTSSTIPPLHLLSQQSNVRRFIHHAASSSTIPIVKCTTLLPQSPLFIYYLNSQMYKTSSTIALFIYYPNSQMYDTSSTIPPVHQLTQQSNVRRFIHHAPSSSTIPIVKCTTLHPQSPCSSISIVKCTTLHPPSPLFIYYPTSQMYDTSSTIPLFIYYPNSQMYDTSSTIPLVHLSHQSNVRHLIHHTPLHLLSQQSDVRHFIHHPPCSSTIPIVKCTTLHPPSPLFIYYPNSQMYAASSTIPPLHLLSQQSNVQHFIHIPPVHLLSQQSNVRHFIHHPSSSSTITIVNCTTLHLSSALFIYPNSQMYDISSTIPLFIYYPNSQMYDTSSTIPLFIYPISQMYDISSTIPLFIYYPNSQMYDTSSSIPPVHLLSQQSNVRHFIHSPPCSSTISIVKCTTLHSPSHSSSTIPIVKCTRLHPPCPSSSAIPIVKCTTRHTPSRLSIYYPNSQMYDTSSAIPPVHLLSQLSNVRRFIHHAPSSSTIPILKCTTLILIPPVHLLSQQSNLRHFIHHPPCSSTIPIVKCTTLHPPSPLFICYPNSQMYDASSAIPPLHLLSQQSNVQHFIHFPPVHLLSQLSNVRRFIHHAPSSSTIPILKCTTLILIPPVHLLSQQSNVRHFIHHPPCSSTIPIVKCTTLHPPSPLFICYPNSQMYDASSTIPPLHLLSQQSNVQHFIHIPPLHLLSQQSNVGHFTQHPPCSSISIVKCTTLHPPSLQFIYYHNS